MVLKSVCMVSWFDEGTNTCHISLSRGSHIGWVSYKINETPGLGAVWVSFIFDIIDVGNILYSRQKYFYTNPCAMQFYYHTLVDLV